MAIEVAVGGLNKEQKSYMFWISGRNNKEGFLMKREVLTPCQSAPALTEESFLLKIKESKYNSLCKCIMDANMNVLNLVIMGNGRMKDIPGLTGTTTTFTSG